MRPLGIFTQPEDIRGIELHHDTDATFQGEPGTRDERPAHVLKIDGVPDGQGADLTITYTSGVVVSQHGILWLTRPGPWAEFVPDVYREPTCPPRPFR